jgi:hypothetical protein
MTIHSEKETNMGFRNAPSIDKYAVGMRFHWEGFNGKWWTVYHVGHNNGAYCVSDEGIAEVFGESIFEKAALDLESVWIGREYTDKLRNDVAAVILSIGPDCVGYDTGDHEDHCHLRKCFLDHYVPIPLPPVPPLSPCPVELEQIVAVKSGCVWVGIVKHIDYERRRFTLKSSSMADDGESFPFDAKIVKLVPGESHATV